MLRFSTSLILAASAVVLASAACGSSVGSEGSTGSSQGGGGSQAMSTGTSGQGGNPCFPDSCSAPSSGPGTGGSTGGVCGGLAGAQCPADYFCDYPDDQCGGDDGTGTCTAKPQGCPDIYQPTCGCDGMVYGNSCEGNAAGVDQSNLGGCKPPEGTFACGWAFCQKADQYCQRTTDDTGGADFYSCLPLPDACLIAGDPSCSCLANEPCGDLCEETVDGDFMVLCSGG